MTDPEEIFIPRSPHQRLQQFETLIEHTPDERLPERLCASARDVLEADAATICVFQGTHVSVPVATSCPLAAEVEELQFSIGDGPCANVRTREPELVADLTASTVRQRWPIYTGELLSAAPYRAVFAFPLAATQRPIGVLKLYREAVGPVNEVVAGAVAARVTQKLLGDGENSMPWLEEPALRRRAQVWHVQSLIMRVNKVTFDEALDLLRAYAFARGRLVRDFAQDVLNGAAPVPSM